jgi:hypothetical protein
VKVLYENMPEIRCHDYLINWREEFNSSQRWLWKFWDITRRNQLEINKRITWTCRLHLPGSFWFLAWLILRPRRWRLNFPQKRQMIFSALQGVISQKILWHIHPLLGNERAKQTTRQQQLLDSTFLISNNWATTEELGFLRSPCRDVITRTISWDFV